MSPPDRILRPETVTITHGYDPHAYRGAAKPPIFPSSTYLYRSAQHAKDVHRAYFDGVPMPDDEDPGYIYARLGHPNLTMVERRLAALDKGADAAVFGSGMAAISAVMLAFLRPGDTVLHSRPLYGGTDGLLYGELAAFGIKAFGFKDGLDGAAIRAEAERALQTGSLGLIHCETPANPTGSVSDIALLSEIAEAVRLKQGRRPLISVDNTFLGPFLQSPLEHGADLCITSLTKYAGGHSDLLAGGVSGSAALIDRLKKLRTLLGSHPDPHVCAGLLRSFETLHLRTERACANARKIADFLSLHPKVRSVSFLGHADPDTPTGALLARQCSGTGSTFSFRIHGGEAEAFRMLDRLSLIRMAVSLGGTETLICHSATTTHYSVPRDRREEVGVDDGTLRISVGIEHADDLIADLVQALDAV
ncbi:cystathionine gamma-synthase family protein [Methylobacterium organophilum]|uniref:cystathionine gamma-synthase family protein n=1 Tax=Methylobacterium organophilum TaxID=410 RepID=UPI001F13C507|nr:cystathionine gamma-synthase family protein [Methylobacterium organophilum]UMY16759.1 cystathionine gamma-synthase family protein [Methylobacterium organophilum]